jgi:type I restriction enzyme S subunit
MRYKPYPKYKKSGVEWLGDVPEGWEIWKLSHAFNLIGSGTTPTSTNKSYYNGHIPWVTTGELREKIIFNTKKMLTTKAIQELSSLKLFPKGSILIAMYGATIGRLGKLGIEATTNQACCVITSSSKILNDYLYYWLLGYKTEIINLGYGGGQPNISQDTISNLKVSTPNIEEQKNIVIYLDQKTKKIDTLIEKQQTLIKLLKEKRQALISHAVTKGLDDSVAMKDSGVEWLGDVPNGWKVCMFKYKTNKITDGAHISPELKNGKYYFLSVKDITSGKLNFLEALLTSTNSYKYLIGTGCKPKKNDILFGKDGTIGVTAIVDTKKDFVISSSLLIFRPKKEIDSSFMNFQCNSNYFKEQVNSFVKGAALKRLSIQNVLKIWAVFPPLKEQEKISNYLDQKTQKIDTLINKATQAIELLKERRTALISAVVTGKVDVRCTLC